MAGRKVFPSEGERAQEVYLETDRMAAFMSVSPMATSTESGMSRRASRRLELC